MFEPPDDVAGECNARLFLADDYGDNTTTMRCGEPLGHEGLHIEAFEREGGQQIRITWTKDESIHCPKHGRVQDTGCGIEEDNPCLHCRIAAVEVEPDP